MQITNQLKTNGYTRVPAKTASSSEASQSDRFESTPHADFDTNLAKLVRRGPEPAAPPPVWSEPISNQDVDQSSFQQQLIEDLGPQFARMQFTQDASKLNGMVPTQSQLQAEFNRLKADPSIPFEYIYDGCYARAHIMCETMGKDNVNNAKMFVMVQNPYGSGKLTAENKYMKARWWYHVAPMVYAVDEKTKKPEPFIMDPSMADRPLRPQEWIGAMWDEKTPIKVDITRNPQYGPLESGGANKTFEESLPHARETCAEYSAELEKIKQDYNESHPPESKAA